MLKLVLSETSQILYLIFDLYFPQLQGEFNYLNQLLFSVEFVDIIIIETALFTLFMEGVILNAFMIGTNVKKLREERKVTQQQLADAIGISFQAVSKWECETAIPDVGLLPDIADYFNVSIDELFKENMSVYKNKAERLLSIYESEIQNSNAFEKADIEFNKLFANGTFDGHDLGKYAYLNDCRQQFYVKKAEEYYTSAIKQGETSKNKDYYFNQRQYILFLSRLSRVEESVKRHIELLEKEPNNPMNYSSLIVAYNCANNFEKAFAIAEKGLNLFPNDVILLVYAGDNCKQLGKFDKAVEYWNKAFKIDPEIMDTRYSLAFFLIEQGKKDEAIAILEQIIDWNNQKGFSIENKWVKSKLNKLMQS